MARLKKLKFNNTSYEFPVEDVKVGTTSVVTDGVATIDLSGKADDNAVVKLTGNQTIAGTKTFSTSPVVPSKTTDATNTGTAIATEAQVYKKQDTLVSGTNIKTINGTSVLGSGDITISTPEESNTKTFYIGSTSDLTNAQAALDWYLAGKNPIISRAGDIYVVGSYTAGSKLSFISVAIGDYYDTSVSNTYYRSLVLNLSSSTVTSITATRETNGAPTVLATNRDYSTPYTPQYNGSPATKKYVDDIASGKQDTLVSGTNIKTINGNSILGSGDITIQSGGLQVSPNSTITGIKYVWYGTESDYAGLSQYYTDTPGDTEFHTF